MKMTMHINEALLAEVVDATGAGSKTEAVDLALRQVARKYRQRERWRVGLGMTAEEIQAAFDPDLATGVNKGDAHFAVAAEEPGSCGSEHRR